MCKNRFIYENSKDILFLPNFSYACGGWIQNAISSNSDRFQLVDKRNQNAIKKLLEVPPTKSEDLNSAVSKAKNFYLSCMNMSSAQEKIHLNHLIDLMEGAGGWHLTGTYNSNFTFDQRVSVKLKGILKEFFDSFITYIDALIYLGTNTSK